VRVNLHVFTADWPEVLRMLRFRDHLRRNDRDRKIYEDEKHQLAARDWAYVQNYADAKPRSSKRSSPGQRQPTSCRDSDGHGCRSASH